MITRKILLAPLSLFAASCLFAQNYKIVNANSGKVLDVIGGSTANGAGIQQWEWLKGLNQQWQIVPIGNGYSRIVNVNSGKVLDVSNYRTDDGAPIQQWDWLSGANQQWQVIPQGSSYNEIVNLNSGKVLDVTNYSLNDGAAIQQWDWLGGLNQQWQIVPVQDTYQVTGQTNVYYDPQYNQVFAIGSTDQDYNTEYYYGDFMTTGLYDNGQPVQGGPASQWGYQPGQVGFGATEVATMATPGHYYEGTSRYELAAEYTEEEVIPNCGLDCGLWYDPFDYSFVATSSEGTDIPIFTTTVWAAPIIVTIVSAVKILATGNNGSSVTVPGSRDIFHLKLRAFIPPAWVLGAGYPADYCIDSLGLRHNVVYVGDNRGFDPFSNSYRASSDVTVSAASGSAI